MRETASKLVDLFVFVELVLVKLLVQSEVTTFVGLGVTGAAGVFDRLPDFEKPRFIVLKVVILLHFLKVTLIFFPFWRVALLSVPNVFFTCFFKISSFF